MTPPASPQPDHRTPALAPEHVRGGTGDAGRVILVGRTGIDQVLRLDPAVELLRVGTALEAVGELAQDAEAGAGTPNAVVIGADVTVKGGAGALIDALRAVDEGVRVFSTGPAASGVYDGVVQPRATLDELHEMFFGPRPTDSADVANVTNAADVPSITNASADATERAHAGPVRAAASQEADSHEAGARVERAPIEPSPITPALIERAATPESADVSRPVAGGMERTTGSADDATVLEAILKGRDVVAPALALIRERLGLWDVHFVAGARAGLGAVRSGVEVSYEGERFGVLTSASVDPELLGPHARTLGLWLGLRRAQERLREAAYVDDLTGAHNRRAFNEMLRRMIDDARQKRLHLSVLWLDIDDFKRYNDRYGHAAGDEILREIVRLLKSVIRPSDRVCRVGGDEFAVIFYEPEGPRHPNNPPHATIADMIKRFQRQVCEHRFPKLSDEAPGSMTVSGGMATFPWDGSTAEQIVDAADQLSIQSKRLGKNQVALGPGASGGAGARVL